MCNQRCLLDTMVVPCCFIAMPDAMDSIFWFLVARSKVDGGVSPKFVHAANFTVCLAATDIKHTKLIILWRSIHLGGSIPPTMTGRIPSTRPTTPRHAPPRLIPSTGRRRRRRRRRRPMTPRTPRIASTATQKYSHRWSARRRHHCAYSPYPTVPPSYTPRN